VVEASRKRGSFDTRWPSALKGSVGAAPTAPLLSAVYAAEALDWDAFSTRYFPGRRRHNMEALTAYATYTQGRESRTTPVRLKVVPTEHVSATVELAEAEEAATRRLPAAIAR
jgi:hypothetical protein